MDELGDFNTAVARAEKLTGIPNASLIEYRIPVDLNVVPLPSSRKERDAKHKSGFWESTCRN